MFTIDKSGYQALYILQKSSEIKKGKMKPFWSLPVYSMILSIMSNHCNCLFMMQSHWTHVLILLIGDNIDTKEEKHHSTHQKHEHPFDALPSLVKCEK